MDKKYIRKIIDCLHDVNKQKTVDFNEIESAVRSTVKAAQKDTYNINNPSHQIVTLSVLSSELMKDNTDGKNDALIGFYANVCKSLKHLIELQTSKEQ